MRKLCEDRKISPRSNGRKIAPFLYYKTEKLRRRLTGRKNVQTSPLSPAVLKFNPLPTPALSVSKNTPL